MPRKSKHTPKAAPKAAPKYIGPPGEKIAVPSLNITFEPSKLDSLEKIESLLKQRPGLARYFSGTTPPE